MDIQVILRTERAKHRISQNELASRARLSRNTIINFETGKRSPRVDDLKSIARALGESENYFFTLNPWDAQANGRRACAAKMAAESALSSTRSA
ncbi:helix-turn-helix transcriptional regulator [Pyramidobacter sp.]|uniref:helix-turn-helix transcriptional regulator n=1 Tax=Pyramidobacter sp. TaxID=1943581 RepID=UPI002A753503|nr:helix-turn-helix transcriptional regulator [Pyramidobacter sp.]MDY3213391.1 helix-turn-helix transcriptional regulator [Pyramidobacter sp.]